MAVSEEPAAPVAPVRVAVEVLAPVPVLVLRLPAAEVADVVLELMMEMRVVLRPSGIPGASDTKVAAGSCEVTTEGWLVMGRGCEVSTVGWPVTTPRELVWVRNGSMKTEVLPGAWGWPSEIWVTGSMVDVTCA